MKDKDALELDRLAEYLEEEGAVVILPDAVTNKIAKIKEKAEKKAEQDCINSYKPMDIYKAMNDYSLMDSIVPACCIHECMVEPDGTCKHGNNSILLDHGLI